MRKSLIGLLAVLPTFLVGFLTAVPAEAALFYMSVKTSRIAVDYNGNGKVYVACYASTTCRGKTYFTYDKSSLDSGYARKYRSYSVPPRSYGYIDVAMFRNSPLNPNNEANPNVKTDERPDFDYVDDDVSLMVIEESPRGSRRVHSYNNMVAETIVSSQDVKGTINAAAGSSTVSNMQVRLYTPLRGGNVKLIDTADVSPGGSYSLKVPFRTNNVPTYSDYRLEIVGQVGGDVRSWWWRGGNDNFTGGGRYIRDASDVSPDKYGDFEADFRYTWMSGTVELANRGKDVSVASPPPSYSGRASDLRELDLERCANVFARVRPNQSSGAWRADFLPATGSTDNRWMVGTRASFGAVSYDVFRGATDERFGSCFDAVDYDEFSRADLIRNVNPAAGMPGINFSLTLPNKTAKIDYKWSGFTPTTADKFIRIREKIPGVPILDMPIAAEGPGSVVNEPEFLLSPGEYLVETGRHNDCTAWLPSIYPDNNAYFKGADRGAERWKTVNGKYAEYSKSYEMGFVRKSPPSGYRGWMYRDYCKSYSSGTLNNVIAVSGNDAETVNKDTSVARRGSVVYGTVKRNGGRSNKEMMVRLSNSGGTIVARTDLTDSKGKFYVAGLPKGTYTISVNSDSWRGIGRSFKGRHTITVNGSSSYSAGTMYFRG